MYRCPACKTQFTPDRHYCDCGMDLTLLVEMTDLTGMWFNAAVEAAREGRDGRALELICACRVAAPDDAEVRYIQSQILGRLGLPAEALEALEEAERLDPDRPGLSRLRLHLKKLLARQRADRNHRLRSCSQMKPHREARKRYEQGNRH